MFFGPRKSHQLYTAHACHFLSSFIIDVNCISHFSFSSSIIVAAGLILQFIRFKSTLSRTHSLSFLLTRMHCIRICFCQSKTIFSGLVILDLTLATSKRWKIQNHSFHLINTLELAKCRFGK